MLKKGKELSILLKYIFLTVCLSLLRAINLLTPCKSWNRKDFLIVCAVPVFVYLDLSFFVQPLSGNLFVRDTKRNTVKYSLLFDGAVPRYPVTILDIGF